MAVVTLLFEASTIFLKARELLILADAAEGALFAANNWAFLLSFFLARIVNGNIESVRWFIAIEGLVATGGARSVPLVRMYQVLNIVLTALNAFWFYRIVSGALRVRKPKAQ